MTGPWTLSILVGLGGFLGSVSRYGLSAAAQRTSIEWPLGTMAANILGCLAIGLLTGLHSRGDGLSPETRLALATGFCGGFTTMSSMVYETAQLLRTGEYLHATLYSAGTFILSLAAFYSGIAAIRIVFRAGGGIWS